MQRKTYSLIALIATLLTLVVVVLGAYTRITDAGLSCPDWPGCYGQLTVPAGEQAVKEANHLYPDRPLEASKAWTEMIHRYLAGSIGLMILFLSVQACRLRSALGKPPLFICLSMLGLLVFQVLLGMWTVTLKLLPLVVASHLLMGMTLLSLLWTLSLVTAPEICYQNLPRVRAYRPFAILGLVIVIFQIASGGWTSTNMAGQVCHGFPVCEGFSLGQLDWAQAFSWLTPLGHMNYLGLLAITSLHRVGALITLIYLGGLALIGLVCSTHKILRAIFGLVLLVLMIQVGLGFMNIAVSRPLWAATLHNGCAALLLLVTILLNIVVAKGSKGS